MQTSSTESSQIEVKYLIDVGLEQGFLTVEEITEFLDDESSRENVLNDTLNLLLKLGISIHGLREEFETTPQFPEDRSKDLAAESSANLNDACETQRGENIDLSNAYLCKLPQIALLSRDEEIKIAMCYEEGLREEAAAAARFPGVIDRFLARHRKATQEKRLKRVLCGFLDPMFDIKPVQTPIVNSESESTGKRKLLDPEIVEARVNELKRVYRNFEQIQRQDGEKSRRYRGAQQRLCNTYARFKLAPDLRKELHTIPHTLLNKIRQHELRIQQICHNCGMPQTSLADMKKWLNQEIAASRPWSTRLRTARDDLAQLRRSIKGLLKQAGVTQANLCAITTAMNVGQKKAISAQRNMVCANLRLVLSVAKKLSYGGPHLLEFVQEGNMGLSEAVEKYDYRRGCRFATHATWWIRQGVARILAEQTRTIRVPTVLVATMNRLRRYQRQMVQELGREPTLAELSDRSRISHKKIQQIQCVCVKEVSLDAPFQQDNEGTIGDFLDDPDAVEPAERATAANLHDLITELLSELSPEEAEFLRMRFGIGLSREYSLDEMTGHLSVTKDEVLRVEARALRKLLKHLERSSDKDRCRENGS